MRRLGIADLGSNSARLMVFCHEPGEWYRITDGIRESIHLGEGQSESRRLSPGAIDRAEVALVFRWLMRRSRLSHVVVSDHGVREGAFYRARAGARGRGRLGGRPSTGGIRRRAAADPGHECGGRRIDEHRSPPDG